MQKTILGITSLNCRCDENAECTGGICKCKSGWTGDGKSCVDINECFGELNVCGAHALCENSPGSYSCQCNIGYIFDRNGKCVGKFSNLKEKKKKFCIILKIFGYTVITSYIRSLFVHLIK